MKKADVRRIIKEEVQRVLKEYTDDFSDDFADDSQFNMSFSFKANNRSQVKMKFVKIKRTDEVWKNIKQISDWIENPGFRDADEAFGWLENMYNANKIQSGEAVVLHWSKYNWILAAKDDRFVENSSFPKADSYKGRQEPIDKRRIDKFIKAIRRALKKHEMVINTGVDDFDKLNDTEFEQVRSDAEKNGYQLVQFEDNYQTTSYSLKKMT